MRGYIFLVLLLTCLFSSFAFAAGGDMGLATDANTDGSAEYPYLIEDFNDFEEFCADPNYWASGVYIRLDCNLDLDSNLSGRVIYSQAPIAGDTDTDSIFDGTVYAGYFDGSNHVIYNLTINGTAYCGLFGETDPNSKIKNLGIENANITGSSEYVGGLVGSNVGRVTGCYSTGAVTGNFAIGGLVGWNDDGSITSCYSKVIVTGSYNLVGGSVGGLVGDNDGSITGCYSTGVVTGGNFCFGGLVGYNRDSITSCYSTGEINSNGSVGGLVGWNDDGSIVSCYSTGAVTGDAYVGGLVGYNYGSIISSYSTGVVNGEEGIGGLVGWNPYSVSITSCFWDVNTSGINTSDGGTKKTTVEMKMESTFTDAGWDFVDVWGIGEGQTYPYIREYSVADISCDGGVNFVDLAILADNWLVGVE